jgi:hypothetical protein
MKPKKMPKIDGLKSHLTLLVMLFVAFSGSTQITIKNSPTLSQLVDENLILKGSEIIGSNATFQGVKSYEAKGPASKLSAITTTIAQIGFTSGAVLSSGYTYNYTNEFRIGYKKKLMLEVNSEPL